MGPWPTPGSNNGRRPRESGHPLRDPQELQIINAAKVIECGNRFVISRCPFAPGKMPIDIQRHLSSGG